MITITNKNIYHSEFSIATLSSLDDVAIIHMDEITNFLSDVVELSESVTFKRLFDIIGSNAFKFNEIFYSSLGGYSLEPYLQEIENIVTSKTEMDYLEVNWFSEKYENDLSIEPSIEGVSSNGDYFAIDFVALNNLKNLVVKLNPNVLILDYNEMKKSNDKSEIDMGNKSFTLFDLFNAIFYEISFQGGPQDKREKFDDIVEIAEDYELETNAVTNKEKLTTIEEMIDKFESDDKYFVKYKELKSRVDENRVGDKRKLSKLKNCLIEKLKIYYIIENSDQNLEQYYKKLTDIEYNMQLLYGEEEDIMFHKFWETPKCTCPKIDNIENYPSKTPIFDNKCPIHKK